MNNEIEEYNNGGLVNKPITFNGSSVDVATLLNLFPPTTGYGFGSFSIPKEKIVDLVAELAVDTTMVIHEDPAALDRYIREELAQKLAKQLIEEDLIQIQGHKDTETLDTIFRAKIKVIQE